MCHQTFAQVCDYLFPVLNRHFTSSFVEIISNLSLSLCQGSQWDSEMNRYVVDHEGRKFVREDRAPVLDML